MTSDELIKLLIAIISIMGSGIMGMVLVLHGGITKRLDNIDIDLKPISQKVAVHEEAIKDLKEDRDKIFLQLDRHQIAIQELQNTKK